MKEEERERETDRQVGAGREPCSLQSQLAEVPRNDVLESRGGKNGIG